ncbi:alpha/beta hydrolase [Chelativorans salis]|uniref:Alpha/beta fold hydrolase n=1 Tax=Chelativorans salis TaxID=2978478 RepID=A0ABT2LQ53_9HYPH|nr:alpha/beta fold hydrolase [Chelativorans sp. EGI FJ00035]MCT7375513.1 alpha/beta fold hydrolase [Chelativorans sp. EGI FJ00035]
MFRIEQNKARKMVSFPLQLVRSLFAIAEHAAPRLAGRAAFALFCRTPNPRRVSPRAREALRAAEPFMMEARRHWLTSDYGHFVCHEFRPPAGGRGWATALVVHGWGSRGEHMRAIIEELRGKGMRVVALDLPGHGASTGRRLNMAMAVAAVKTAELWLGPFSIMVGHSLGGAVVVNAAVGSIEGIAPVAAQRLVTISAPNAMQNVFDSFARHCGLGRSTRDAFYAEVERVTGRPLRAFEGAAQLTRLSVPVLVLHAPDDREVSAADAEALCRAGPHVERIWVEGAGHRRILSDRRAVMQVGEFMARPFFLAAAQ